MKTGTMYMLTGMLAMLAALAMAAPAAAWPTGYDYDGHSLLTNESGTLKGFVYIDEGNHSGLAAPPYVVGYTSIPTGTVRWAHLYTGVWGGTENHTGWANITVTNSSGTYDMGPARLNKSDMDASTCCSGNGKWLICKDVTDYLDRSTLAATVTTSGTIDGRVYGIVLVAAIENTSGHKMAYWINVGNVNLRYDAGYGELNNALTLINGTAYSSDEAKVYAMQYVGTANQPDYLYFNAPSAADSPRNLSNIAWNISKYTQYQLDDDDVADCSEGSYFDLDVFTTAHDGTPLKEIVNLVGNNELVFWRGHDDDNNGEIDASWTGTSYEGEAYVSPIMAALVLDNISRVYDFSNKTPDCNLSAYYNTSFDGTLNDIDLVNTSFTSSAIETDDNVYYTTTASSDRYAAQRFTFEIDEDDNIQDLNVTWIGKGRDSTNGATLYLWNDRTNTYDQVDTEVSTSEITLNYATDSPANYIDNKVVNVLVVQNGVTRTIPPPGTTSTLQTDYVRLEVVPHVA
ncbi:MAG: hypothetical protein PWP08_1448 [Methanofollis sp.]|nr:hypothetical protein [Methanofollis sp.]